MCPWSPKSQSPWSRKELDTNSWLNKNNKCINSQSWHGLKKSLWSQTISSEENILLYDLPLYMCISISVEGPGSYSQSWHCNCIYQNREKRLLGRRTGLQNLLKKFYFKILYWVYLLLMVFCLLVFFFFFWDEKQTLVDQRVLFL